jgi:hypothetical protein
MNRTFIFLGSAAANEPVASRTSRRGRGDMVP